MIRSLPRLLHRNTTGIFLWPMATITFLFRPYRRKSLGTTGRDFYWLLHQTKTNPWLWVNNRLAATCRADGKPQTVEKKYKLLLRKEPEINDCKLYRTFYTCKMSCNTLHIKGLWPTTYKKTNKIEKMIYTSFQIRTSKCKDFFLTQQIFSCTVKPMCLLFSCFGPCHPASGEISLLIA